MAHETRSFPDEVAGLFEALGFEVRPYPHSHWTGAPGTIFHCVPSTRELALTHVLCLAEEPAPEERVRIIAALAEVGPQIPRRRFHAISWTELSADAVADFQRAGIDCSSYWQAIRQELPLDRYLEALLAEDARWRAEHWRGGDWFVPPDAILEGEFAPQSAMAAVDEWLASPGAGLLMIHSDTGIGKSTFLRCLARRMASAFEADCRAHPLPVHVPLLDVRLHLSWESLIESHFASRGIPHVHRAVLDHLLRSGRAVLIYDAFDEIADTLSPEARRESYRELTRPLRGNAKAILTCRTQHFEDQEERHGLLNGNGARHAIASFALQPFSEPQIRTYLAMARPETVAEDWARINEIYHLADLAQRPMLLVKITQLLHAMAPGAPLNLAELYAEIANSWLEREAGKQRRAQQAHILQLIPEIAWTIWASGRRRVPKDELYPIVRQLNEAHRYGLSPEELQAIAGNLTSASFFTRDETGALAFNHLSFENYFLARKLRGALERAGSDGMASLRAALRTRPFDPKVALFLVHFGPEPIDWPLQRILREPEQPLITANARHLLYWSVRARCGMDERIADAARLRAELVRIMPANVDLAGLDEGETA